MELIRHSRPLLGREEERAAVAALRSSFLAEGPQVAALERAVAAGLGRPGAVAVSSGTAALALALRAVGAAEGCEVIVPSYVCTSVLDAVLSVGAEPRVVDVSLEDLNIDAAAVRGALSARTAAVIAAHQFGNPAPVVAIAGLGPPVVEDLAQCVGAERDGRLVGTVGACAVLSLYATKMLTSGYGGVFVAGTQRQLALARDLRAFDNRASYKPRLHVSMSDLNAAVGLVQWGRLGEFIRRRRMLARRYDAAAGHAAVRPTGRGVYYRYLVWARQGADAAMREFARRGIEAKRPVFRPLHRYLGLDRRRFPASEKAHRQIVSVPLYPALREPEVRRILAALEEVIRP